MSPGLGAKPPPRPPRADRLGRGVLLALLVHGVLIVALTLGVHWRSSEPAGVEAELWAAVPQVAAPRADPPPPAPPEPRPEPPQPAPRKVETPPPPSRDAEIAIEKARREKQHREAQELERVEQQRQREREKAAREQREKEELAKQKAEEQKKKQAAERDAERRAAEAEARLAKQREENLQRMMGQAGANGPQGSQGTAAQSAGPSAGYAGRVKAKVKPNIRYLDEPAGNPSAEVEVRAAPDGTIVDKRLVKSSGLKEWDEAVLRAIDRTETLPRDVDGRVPSPIIIVFRPRE